MQETMLGYHVQYLRIENLTEDGGVVKKVIEEGYGEIPHEGCDVTGREQRRFVTIAHYTGRLEDGTKFDSSRDRKEPFKFKLGVGQVIKGWDLGFASMKVGEHALLVCKSDYAYGSHGTQGIPANATLYFDVELIDFEDKKSLEKMTFRDRLNKAEALKSTANELFAKQMYSRAIPVYEKAFVYAQWANAPIAPGVDFPMQPTAEETEEGMNLLQILNNNKALCLYKSGYFKEAIDAVCIEMEMNSINLFIYF